MNPSASGWINKFGHIIKNGGFQYASYQELYNELLENGFIYGIHLSVPQFIATEHPYTEDEVAKTNLLIALYFSYVFETGTADFNAFVEIVFEYYTSLEVSKISFLNKILSGKKTEAQLEKLLDSRIYLNGSAFSRAFGNSLTNSLLYVDILIFRRYLQKHPSLISHAQLLEYVAINIGYEALNSKETEESAAKLMQLLAASLSYVDLNTTELNKNSTTVLYSHFNTCEKDYLMDMACLTVWEDGQLEGPEASFIHEVGRGLDKGEIEVKTAMNNVMDFFGKNKEK